MAGLEPIPTTATTRSRPSRPQSTHSESGSGKRSQLRHDFSGQHLDDHSTYHGNDDVPDRDDEKYVEDESDYSEQVNKDENRDAEEDGVYETSEVRGGILTERDLEAPLEKKQTTRSVRDPNLVR